MNAKNEGFKKTNYISLSIFFLQYLCVSSEKVLVIHPVYAGSHILAIRKITDKLIHNNHVIKVIRFNESGKIPVLNTPQISEIVLSINNSDGNIPYLSKDEKSKFEFPSTYMWHNGLRPTAVFSGGIYTAAASCKTLLENKTLLAELKEEKFILAIVDLIYNECGLALSHYLGLPVVAYWGLFFTSGETQYTTAFNPPSMIPHTYAPFSNKMNFFQRFINFMYGIGSHLVMQFHFYQTNYYIQKHLPNSPHPSELLSNISGMLINSVPALDYPKQLPPSFFLVGGMHIKGPEPLSQELKEFIESAHDGVILMSFGFNFDFESIPGEVFDSFFNAFSKLKQKVIVRSKGVPTHVPTNVKILPHLLQSEILAHPNVILFITHCGMHGVVEAIHHGVKMVAIPIFFDQMNVALRLEDKGVAVMLNKGAGDNEIYEAVTKILSDPSYEDNMRHLSKLYHDSFENPLDRSVWLVEHVMKFKGADYLKLCSKELNFFQYFGVDILVFMLLFLLIFVKLFIKLYYHFKYRSDAKIKYQ